MKKHIHLSHLLTAAIFMAGAGPVHAVNSVSNTTTHAVHATVTDALAALIADGQTLVLAPGLYSEPELHFLYAVTLQGPQAVTTILVPAADSRIATVDIPSEWGVTDPVVFAGLTLRGGNASGNGGAVNVTEGSVIIQDCIVSSNTASGDGGAFFCMSGTGATLLAKDSLIVGNHALKQGGGTMRGVYERCSFVGNRAADGGAASSAVLEGCSVTGNTATGQGGGTLACSLSRCRITDNSALFGGGAYRSALSNTLMTNNAATQSGGALYLSAATNCTLVANRAGNAGGGLWGGTAVNSILHDNHGISGANYDATASLTWCCAAPLAPGVGNIAAYPGFRNRAAGDYSLLSHSACTNAGLTTAAPAGTDLNGGLRVQGPAIDIGAYEHDPALIDYIGFDLWLNRRGLPFDQGAQFNLDHNSDGIPNGLDFAFGDNRVDGSLFTVRQTGSGMVAETAVRDPESIGFVDVWVETIGSLAGPPTWIPAVAVPEGAPEGAAWFRREAPGAAERGFFRLKAALP